MKRLVLAALVAASTIVIAPAAQADTQGFNDTLFESSVNTGRADIEWIGATYTTSGGGGVGVAMGTAVQDSLSGPNWVNDEVAISWDLITPTGTYEVWFWDADRASILSPSFETVCEFTPDQTDSGLYFAGFPASCIGNPSSFKMRAYISYNDVWYGTGRSYDFAPNSSADVCCHVFPTDEPTPTPTPDPTPDPVLNPGTGPTGPGYWMLADDGTISPFGGARKHGPGQHLQDPTIHPPFVDIEPSTSGNGYWTLEEHGGMRAYGDAHPFSVLPAPPGDRYVSMSATPNGNGMWAFTAAGRVFTTGGATHFGDMGGTTLNAPVIDSVATPDGTGYWMVAADGGIFTFGTAAFAGSTGAMTLNKPVVSMAADPDGLGYWLVASDGGIFAFAAPFYGSMGATPLNKPVSGMVPGSNGYLMVAEDGGVFTFGDVGFHGSLGNSPSPRPIGAIALKKV